MAKTTYYISDFNSIIRATTKVAKEKIDELIKTKQVHLWPIAPKDAKRLIKAGTEYIKISNLNF